jgi:peptidyl-prolyl cis-trans isomerase C
MNVVYLPMVLCAAFAAGALQAADTPKAADAPAPVAASADAAAAADVPLVSVNGVAYSLDLFRMFYFERLQQTQAQDTPELQQQAFNEFMNLVVTAQQAEALKLPERHDVQIGLEMQRMRLLSSIALQSMAQEIEPTEEELKKGYDELAKQAKETQYQARHILVKDEAEAKKVIAELDKGGDFAELAKKHSTGPNAKAGGELGWFTSSQIDNKPFSDAVAALKKGAYTKAPVNTKFGWHVILLEDTRTPEPPSFDDAKPQLIASYQRAKLGEKLGELRQAAKVDLNEAVVKLKDGPVEEPAAAESEKK